MANAPFRGGTQNNSTGVLLDGTTNLMPSGGNVQGIVIRQNKGDYPADPITNLTGTISTSAFSVLTKIPLYLAHTVQFGGTCSDVAGTLTFRPVWYDASDTLIHVDDEATLTSFSLPVSPGGVYPSFGESVSFDTLGAAKMAIYFPSLIVGTWTLRIYPI